MARRHRQFPRFVPISISAQLKKERKNRIMADRGSNGFALLLSSPFETVATADQSPLSAKHTHPPTQPGGAACSCEMERWRGLTHRPCLVRPLSPGSHVDAGRS